VLQTLGFSITGVLAFGGVGGIAIGFAAKDLLANFFGGLMVYLDRPFIIGDWIRSPDQEIEGTVEHIGWRQTRIRTFDKRPLYVPNSTFTHISVENPSRMSNRRINETIGLRYDDAAKVGEIINAVKSYLQNSPDIDNQQTLIVNFNAFAPSSLDFFIYTFTKTTDWILYHEIKQRVLLDILAIITDHGADIAFPTTTVKLDNMPELFVDPIQQSRD
jgi:MscS family membrane protein